jgi:hypothetical protein
MAFFVVERLYLKTYYVVADYCTDSHLNEAGGWNNDIGSLSVLHSISNSWVTVDILNNRANFE